MPRKGSRIGELVVNRPEDLQLFQPTHEHKAFIVRHWKGLWSSCHGGADDRVRAVFAPQAACCAAAGGRNGQNRPVAVSVATAVLGDIQVKIPALGTVTPLATITVRTQITGTLQQINSPKAKSFIRVIRWRRSIPAPTKPRSNRWGNLKRDQALLADAKLDLKRYEGLIKEDPSRNSSSTRSARWSISTGHRRVRPRSGKHGKGQSYIYAHSCPVTGRVGLRQVDQGNYVTPGDANGIVSSTSCSRSPSYSRFPRTSVRGHEAPA